MTDDLMKIINNESIEKIKYENIDNHSSEDEYVSEDDSSKM